MAVKVQSWIRMMKVRVEFLKVKRERKVMKKRVFKAWRCHVQAHKKYKVPFLLCLCNKCDVLEFFNIMAALIRSTIVIYNNLVITIQ